MTAPLFTFFMEEKFASMAVLSLFKPGTPVEFLNQLNLPKFDPYSFLWFSAKAVNPSCFHFST
jgi:hypothetical protein